MTRIIAALSLVVTSMPVFAEHRDGPFDPYQQGRRGEAMQQKAPVSSGRSVPSAPLSESVWTKDHNFIAPAP